MICRSKGKGGINLDGSIHDGVDPSFSKRTLNWLKENGWNIKG